MADTSTKNYGWIKPEVGGSPAIWGAKLNADLDAIDTQLQTVASQTGGLGDAPADGNVYGRENNGWVSIPPSTGVPEAPTTGATFGRNNAAWAPLPPPLVDAPNNGVQYGRQSANWTPVPGGVSEAPSDGQLYGRTNATWVVVASGGSGGISDAPNDGTTYARKSNAWTHLSHNDISDWAATLANYYPTSNPSGYQTASQVTTALGPYALTSSLPAPSITTPLADGTAAIGTATTYARADHIHPTGAGSPVKWTQIATQTPGVGAANVSFTGLSQIYGALLVIGAGVTSSVAAQIQMQVSADNGATYSPANYVIMTGTGTTINFVATIQGYSLGVSQLTSNGLQTALPASPAAVSSTANYQVGLAVHTGGCNALRFQLSSGTYSGSGSITIYGR